MIIKYKDGSHRLMWPIRLTWAEQLSACWFKTHGWQVGSEKCSRAETGRGAMPGWRSVYGWTFHLGRLKVKFGSEGGATHPTHDEVLAHSRKVAPDAVIL